MASITIATFCILLMLLLGSLNVPSSTAFDLNQLENTTVEDITEIGDELIKKLGWDKNHTRVSKVDTLDMKCGEIVDHELDIQLGNDMIPLKFSDNTTSWHYLDELPSNANKFLSKLDKNTYQVVLPSFQLMGPIEILIQDSEQLRLVLPNNVETGVLKKVLLADGAIVIVEGARGVSLERPLQFPLPLLSQSYDENGVVSSLVALGNRLKDASISQKKALLSLRIVGATSIIATSSTKNLESSASNLRVKSLAPGVVELVNPNNQDTSTLTERFGKKVDVELTNLILWPFPSLNGNHSTLRKIEAMLINKLGTNAYKMGSFKILRAKSTATMLIQIQFEIEKNLTSNSFPSLLWPKWMTRPTFQRFQFEVVAKVVVEQEGKTSLVPLKIQQLRPEYKIIQSHSWTAIHGNTTYSKTPQPTLHSSPLTF